MALEIISLVVVAIVSFVFPAAWFGGLLAKNSTGKKRIGLLFGIGVLVYVVMQWGLKEHGLTFLFNNTSFMEFMNQHYIPYLLVIAFVGAVFAILPFVLVVYIIQKKQMSFVKVLAYGLGYTMAESVLLVGLRGLNTIITYFKDGGELDFTATELFLSGYERILMTLLQMAIFVVVVYMIQNDMSVGGTLLGVFAHCLLMFLPGFLIAFSLENYYEVYDRSVGLLLTYIILTVAMVCALAIFSAFRPLLKDCTGKNS